MPVTPIWKHFAALLYDIFPLIGVFLATSLLVLILRGGTPVERYSPWFIGILLFEFGFYYIYSWKVGGQTLGMRAWKMKVFPIDPQQNNLSWAQATVRLFVGMISTLLVGAGLFWKLFSKNKHSWMDIISRSETRSMDV